MSSVPPAADLLADIDKILSFGIRQPGHPGDRQAENWAARRFTDLGLEDVALEHAAAEVRGDGERLHLTGLREPEREPEWEGVRPAQAWGATAPQRKQRVQIIPELLVPGPDYLNVNVFTPDLAARGLPVLVWIHGGAFVMGTPGNPWYNPAAFTKAGIVFVSITYRLGFEGLLPIPGYPPNRSVHDWLAALTWVQECISAFGGDPGNVTLAGQSAGSEACLTLLSTPRAHGLFRRVIAMSGSLSVSELRSLTLTSWPERRAPCSISSRKLSDCSALPGEGRSSAS